MKLLYISIGTIVLLGLLNILGITKWIGRYSTPVAVYSTIYPYPFYAEHSYGDGQYQNVLIGVSLSEMTPQILSHRCKMLIGDQLVDVSNSKQFREILNNASGNLIFRCKKSGIAWNEIIVVESGKITQIRIAGGLWT